MTAIEFANSFGDVDAAQTRNLRDNVAILVREGFEFPEMLPGDSLASRILGLHRICLASKTGQRFEMLHPDIQLAIKRVHGSTKRLARLLS